MDRAYLYATVAALLAFLLSLLLREVRLRAGEDAPDDQSAVAAATFRRNVVSSAVGSSGPNSRVFQARGAR